MKTGVCIFTVGKPSPWSIGSCGVQPWPLTAFSPPVILSHLPHAPLFLNTQVAATSDPPLWSSLFVKHILPSPSSHLYGFLIIEVSTQVFPHQ